MIWHLWKLWWTLNWSLASKRAEREKWFFFCGEIALWESSNGGAFGVAELNKSNGMVLLMRMDEIVERLDMFWFTEFC